MKNTILLLTILSLSALLHSQTTFDMQLTEVSNDGVNYVIKLELQMNGEDIQNFKLGSASFQFKFPNEALGNPVLLSTTLPSSVPYFEPTVTTPRINECSFNVDLLTPETGIDIAQAPAWTTLGEISFTVINPALITPMEWSYNGGTTETVVFLDDESTQIYRADGDVSINELTKNKPDFTVFPNPNLGESLTISFAPATFEVITIEVIDNLGKIIYSEKQSIGKQRTSKTINFNKKLVAGIYFIRINDGDKIDNNKFIVE